MVNRIRSDLWPRRTVLGAGLGLGLGGLCVSPVFAQRPLLVFAAASLKTALDEVAASWAAPVSLSYGGSGTLARQVARGAPADIVILAAADWMDWLAAQVEFSGTVQSVARNRLVLAGPAQADPVPLTLEALGERLGPTGRIAMGDPMSVPAGRYGQQALETLGLWSGLGDRVLLAENVRAALAYIARGDVSLGLVYASDTVGSEVEEVAAIPATSHQPVLYPGAVLAGAGGEARAFLDHVSRSGEVFAKHGFLA